jgi:hypothetical protein
MTSTTVISRPLLDVQSHHATLNSDFELSSQDSINSGRQSSGLKRPREDETSPSANRIARAADSKPSMTIQDMSISSTPSEPLFMGGPPIYRAPSAIELPFRSRLQMLNTHLSPTPFASHVPVDTLPEANYSANTGFKVLEDKGVKQGPAPDCDQRIKQEISTEPYESKPLLYHGFRPGDWRLSAHAFSSYGEHKKEEDEDVKQGPPPQLAPQIKQEIQTDKNVFKPVSYHGLLPAGLTRDAVKYSPHDGIKRENAGDVKQGPAPKYDQWKTESYLPKSRLHHGLPAASFMRGAHRNMYSPYDEVRGEKRGRQATQTTAIDRGF